MSVRRAAATPTGTCQSLSGAVWLNGTCSITRVVVVVGEGLVHRQHLKRGVGGSRRKMLISAADVLSCYCAKHQKTQIRDRRSFVKNDSSQNSIILKLIQLEIADFLRK